MKKIRNVIAFLVAAFALLFTGSQVFADTTGTITVQNASKGQTYTIYKLFDATVGSNGAIAYTLPSGKNADQVSTYFDVDTAGNVTAKGGLDVSTNAFKTWAEGFGTIVGEPKTATSNTVTFDNLGFGYYFIKSSLGAVITVDSTNPNATINDKNTTAPSIPDGDGGKKILVGGSATDTTTAKVGDTVNYQIKFNATNYVTSSATDSKLITGYTITDTPSNVAIDESSINVKVGNTTISSNITKSVDSNTGVMTINLTWASEGNSLYNSPAEVVITYNGVVEPGAADAAATNQADISYTTADGTTTFDDDDETTVNTYQFTLNKTDGTNSLTGAEFKLYDAADNGNEIAVVKDGNHYRVAKSGESGVVIEAGSVVIKGLKGDTTYYLEEIKAPNGYNKLTERKPVPISTTEANTANVVNKKGTELPSTGSFGTRMLYVVGAAAILVASVYMVAKRRVKNL
ncbi:Cna protein B-type domain-containing protein [Streptococcus equinus]|uniref:SpaA isopeptide-forming pilin-related protein n=1 Tax=Streptococcus equinus TaxID=1335 RepID=UPI000F6B4C74|nr:SpaA isopeptide-forming pilin-related protein [Streptococcus equinus]VED92913.1 Cna protein B-type domain-containing protein [Streptococcus equinus]VTS90409.1 Cna protein B-type domain-containing protein [Streptococcus equinus]